MSSPRFEAFLARIYVDHEARQAFLSDPLGAAQGAGLTGAECAALVQIDRPGLRLAAASYEHKRRARREARRTKEGAG